MSKQIDRAGTVRFHDAMIKVWEEPPPDTRCMWSEDPWTRQFKKEVFLRIVQQMNRIGWTCRVPEGDVASAMCLTESPLSHLRDHRYCTKGDLKADLSLTGRTIEIRFFQNVNAPDRPDHEGRYQFDKEKHMPYTMLLELRRTRLKIRDYLCNVFSGYKFTTDRHDGRTNKRGPDNLTADEWIDGCYQTSWHFKGDPEKDPISDYNSRCGDGTNLKHTQRVWFIDYYGRVGTGIAYYNINNMWWIKTGRYDVSNISTCDICSSCPENPRVKRNARRRSSALNGELQKAIDKENYERAIVIRDILRRDPNNER